MRHLGYCRISNALQKTVYGLPSLPRVGRDANWNVDMVVGSFEKGTSRNISRKNPHYIQAELHACGRSNLQKKTLGPQQAQQAQLLVRRGGPQCRLHGVKA